MLSDLPFIMIRSLILTLAVELALAAALKVRSPKGLGITALVNLLTNPALVCLTYLVQYVVTEPVYYAVLAVCELAVLFAEGFVYRKTLDTKLNPFVFSLILNACSFAAGVAVNTLWKI